MIWKSGTLTKDEVSVSGSGTLVIQTPKASQTSALFRDQGRQSSSTSTSLEEVSTSGTVVFHGRHDDSDSPWTPRSRLGIQERSSSASLEDSAANLAQAKAAIQGGLRKGNARERFVLGKINTDGQENRKRGQMTNSSDSSRVYSTPRQGSEDEETAEVVPSSSTLLVLLIPSIKEAVADDSEGSAVNAITNSLINMERMKPGSCEVLVSKMLQQLASSKESSLKDLQELAARIFGKCKTALEETQNANAGADNKKQQNKELNSNANLSPLARFLLSRWQGHISRDLNPT